MKFKENNNFSERKMARYLSTKRRTLKNWIDERNTLPYQVYNKILNECPTLKIFEKYTKDISNNWRSIKGGNKSSRVNIKEKMRLLRIKKEIKRELKTKKKKRKNLELNKKIDLKKIIAIALLTDGYLSSKDCYRINFYSKDIVLKNYIHNILDNISNYQINSYFDKKKKGHFVRLCDIGLANELLNFCPNYKTSPSVNQEIDDYMKEAQPTIKFLKNSNKETKILCLRMAFSTDGSISLNKNGGYELNLACYHPKLCLEWQELIEEFKINAKIGKDKKEWGGVDGLRIYDLESITKFFRLGGFIDGVKISNKSKFYKGIEKNKLLRAIVERPRGLAWTRFKLISLGVTRALD